jgi:hypothetical protein
MKSSAIKTSDSLDMPSLGMVHAHRMRVDVGKWVNAIFGTTLK